MKATANKKMLTAAVNAAIQAVDRKATLPILRCIKFTAHGVAVRVQATNLELAVTRNAVAHVTTDGACAVDAAKLKAALKAMPGLSVDLAMGEGGWLRLQSGGVKMDLATLDAAKFPPVPEPEKGWRVFAVRGKVLADLIDKTGFCASTDEGRVNLNGAYLERAKVGDSGVGFRMVATDGHRLAKAEAEAPGAASLPAPMTIPRAALGPLADLARTAGDGPVAMYVRIEDDAPTALWAEWDYGDSVVTKLINKEFPDYNQVIPDEIGHTFQVEADALSAALKAVTALSRDRSKAVKFAPGEGGVDRLVVSATNCDLELVSQTVKIEGLDRPMEPVGFNAKYLLEALGKAKGGTVEFGFADADDYQLVPVRLTNLSDPFWRYVVMPMRVTS